MAFGAGAMIGAFGSGAAAAGMAATARGGPPGLSRPEVQGLRDLFGRSSQGVSDLLERLGQGQNVPLPPGVTPETLQKYRDIAEQAVQQGKDALGVQASRMRAIDMLLNQIKR